MEEGFRVNKGILWIAMEMYLPNGSFLVVKDNSKYLRIFHWLK